MALVCAFAGCGFPASTGDATSLDAIVVRAGTDPSLSGVTSPLPFTATF